jgi:hypothetical protein
MEVTMSEDKHDNVIIELYKQAMEEIHERRRIEWQTFIAVNAIYGIGLKLLYSQTCKLTIPESVAITILTIRLSQTNAEEYPKLFQA